LEHVGRNSGSQYETVLEVIKYNPSSGEVTVMSGLGRTSDWYRNVEAAGHAKITIGRRTTIVHAGVLDDRDAAAVVGDYERRNRLIMPIVRPILSALAEFKYDGAEDSQLALVRRLPLVRFTPASSTVDP
jgi:deazaflavin-dependent oxidoreductase (nitroreductase family)